MFSSKTGRSPIAGSARADNSSHADNHAALREAYDALKRDGVAKLYYLPGDSLLGDDAEGSNDGSHPSDLGFVRQADAFEPVLRQALAVGQ